MSWLPKAEHPAVMRFKFARDKHLALANLLLRRHYFSQELQVSWFDLEFDRLPAGKPILVYIKTGKQFMHILLNMLIETF